MRKAVSPLRGSPDSRSQRPPPASSRAALARLGSQQNSSLASPRYSSRVSIGESIDEDPCPTPPPVRDRRTAPDLILGQDDAVPARRPSPKRLRSGIFSRVMSTKKHQIPYVDPSDLPDDYYLDDDTRSLETSIEVPESPTSPSTVLPYRPSKPPSTMPARSTATSIYQQSRASRARSPDTIRPGSGASYESHSSLPSMQGADVKQVLHWMDSSRGRVRGDVHYRTKVSPTAMSEWGTAYCFVKAEDGSLRYECRSSTLEQDESLGFQTLVENLYGCQVHVGLSTDGRPAIFVRLRQQNTAMDRSGNVISSKKMSLREQNAYLRETGGFKSPAAVALPQIYYDLELRPIDETQINYWLAALLCWESILHGRSSLEEVNIDRLFTHTKSSQEEGDYGTDADEEHATIKVSEVRLHDSVVLSDLGTQRAQHHLPLAATCALRANGEFTIRRADGQASFLINLPELPRSAICALDSAITDAKYSLFIGLSHASSMKASLRIRPLVLSFPTKPSYESWFCLLQALAAPELHRPDFAQFTDDFTLSDNFGSLDPHAYWDYSLQRQLEVKITNVKIYDQFEAPAKGSKARPPSMQPSHEYNVGLLIDGHAISRITTRASASTGDVSSHDCLKLGSIPNEATELSLRVIKRDRLREQPEDLRPGSDTTSSSTQDVEYGEALICHSSLETTEDQKLCSILINRVGMQVGEITLSWDFNVNATLPTNAYDDTMKLLRSFDNGLSVKLYERMPSNLAAQYSALFLNVFQCSNLAVPWLKELISEEVTIQAHPRKVVRDSTSTQDPSSSSNNTLFRDNTLLTRALDEYMKRLGRTYLEETLGPLLRTIQEDDEDCEIDPDRVDKTAAKRNWNYLLVTLSDIWSAIASSPGRCPRELRALFKHARDEAFHAFGPRSPQVYSSVTAFVFLRFFVPAIMAPHVWDLVPDPPTARSTRTFKNLSRAINTLANMTEFGVKQQWMVPMNDFVVPNKQSMVDYINSLCHITTDDIARQPPKDIAMRIMSRQHLTRRNALPHLPGLAAFAPSLRAIMAWWLSYVESAAGTALAALDVSTDAFDPSLSKFTRTCREMRAKSRDLIRLTPRAPRRESVWAADWLAQAESIEEHPETVWRVPLSRRGSAPTRAPSVPGSMAPISAVSSASAAPSMPHTSRASVRSEVSEASTERGARGSVVSRTGNKDGKDGDKDRDKARKKEEKKRDKEAEKKDRGARRKSPQREDPYENMRRKMGFV